jgi:hypothetical protein
LAIEVGLELPAIHQFQRAQALLKYFTMYKSSEIHVSIWKLEEMDLFKNKTDGN